MKTALLVAALAGAAAVANASVISDWAAAPNGASIAASNVATNITGVDLTRGAGLVLQGSSSTFNSNSWTVGGNLATAQANNDYLQFGVTVDSGFSLNLFDLEIRYDRSGTGPTQAAILFSTDNFATSTTVFTDAAVSDTGEDNFITLGLNGITGTGLFRVFAWGASGSGGTFDIETINFAGGGTYGIRLNGEVVPTPGALALLGLGGLVAGRRRR
jgi:hypothetical protein